VKEGRINFQELTQLNKKEDWLIHNLKNQHNTVIDNVLLATIDCKDNLKVFLYK
jgi:uncharacterized membrane protein YcaP (DUF421 family)